MSISCLHLFALLRRFLLPAALLLGVAQAQAGLVLHYKFDETSGTTVADSSGSGNTGTLTNMTGSEWTTGSVGGGLSFDGTDDYVQAIGYKGVTGRNARSIALWIKTSTPSRGLYDWGSTTGPGENAGRFAGGLLIAEYMNGNKWPHTETVIDGQWHHMVVTLPLNGIISDTLAYVDGVEAVPNTSGQAGTVNTVSAQDVIVGARFNSTTYFQGEIDDFRIYDHALSASEVSALYSGGGAPEPAETFAFLGLLTTAGLGFREWRARRKATTV
jgi:hypothetical protein